MIIDHKDPKALENAIHYLNNDELFIYPTDTLYGFGGNSCSEKVLDSLYEIKNRPEHMPVSLIARDLDMIRKYAFVSEKTEKLACEFLPGALTLVLPAKTDSMPEKLFSAQGFLGFRIPDHDFCHKICLKYDKPVITTSVNKSGQPALNDMESIHDQFGKMIKLFISDKVLDQKSGTIPSTVILIDRDDKLSFLREGAIPRSQINNILQ